MRRLLVSAAGAACPRTPGGIFATKKRKGGVNGGD